MLRANTYVALLWLLRTTALIHWHWKGNVVFAAELARRFGERGIVSAAVNPGNIRTDLQRELPKIQDTILVRPVAPSGPVLPCVIPCRASSYIQRRWVP